MSNQGRYVLPQLPEWVTTERFDIQARAEKNPGKDEMRLMMRSLLADRFKLAVHYETLQVPLFAIVLAKPGKTGPQLQLHPIDTSCPTTRADVVRWAIEARRLEAREPAGVRLGGSGDAVRAAKVAGGL